jgi:rhomboid protease GluP
MLFRPDPETLVWAVIYANAALYALSLLLVPRGIGMSANPLRFLSPSNTSLLLLGATGSVPIDGLGRWWTLLTAGWLHGSILHVFFNMAALRQLGPLIHREYGPSRAVALYLLGSVGGFLVSYAARIPFTIGASAAVCGLIGAALYYGRSRGGVYGSAVFQQVGGWAVGIFLFGFLVPGINNWAHGGGMAAGFLLGHLLGYEERGREQPWHRWLAGGCVAATALALAWGLATALLVRFSG